MHKVEDDEKDALRKEKRICQRYRGGNRYNSCSNDIRIMIMSEAVRTTP